MARVIGFYVPPGYQPKQRQSETEGGNGYRFQETNCEQIGVNQLTEKECRLFMPEAIL